MLQRARVVLNGILAQGVSEEGVRRVSEILAPSLEEFLAVLILMRYYLNQSWTEVDIVSAEIFKTYPERMAKFQPKETKARRIHLLSINAYDSARHMATDGDLETVTNTLMDTFFR